MTINLTLTEGELTILLAALEDREQTLADVLEDDRHYSALDLANAELHQAAATRLYNRLDRIRCGTGTTLDPDSYHEYTVNDHGCHGLTIVVESDGEGVMYAQGGYALNLVEAVAPYVFPDVDLDTLDDDERERVNGCTAYLLDRRYGTVTNFYAARYGGAELVGESSEDEFLRYETVLDPSPTDTSENDVLDRGQQVVWDWAARVMNEHDRGTFGCEYAPRLLWEALGSPVVQLA